METFPLRITYFFTVLLHTRTYSWARKKKQTNEPREKQERKLCEFARLELEALKEQWSVVVAVVVVVVVL